LTTKYASSQVLYLYLFVQNIWSRNLSPFDVICYIGAFRRLTDSPSAPLVFVSGFQNPNSETLKPTHLKNSQIVCQFWLLTWAFDRYPTTMALLISARWLCCIKW
jgi:hypothetical protein